MPDLVTKQQLAVAAKALAGSFELVQRGSTTFIPVDWRTLSPSPTPRPEDSIWQPLTREDKQQLARDVSMILFSSDSELRSFEFMLSQLAKPNVGRAWDILVKTQSGLRMLNSRGDLVVPDGTFTPNYVAPMLNEDPSDKQKVMDVLVEWLETEEAAESLLSHLATALSPSYSAVKYVLLIGEGRNGKGVLLAMLAALFGPENVSNVTRQMIAERSPSAVELNNKLINIIFDGEMGYIKDSSMEKTLVAGEPGVVRMLYESGTTRVQTNALFVEALNLEPKTRDKSAALQKRLARFAFPRVYAQDKAFHKEMTSEPMLGALLSLLIDRYVREEDVAERLQLTQASIDLQVDQVFLGSPILQFLEWLESSDHAQIVKIENGQMPTDVFLASFKPWAMGQGLNDRGDGDLLGMMKTAFDLGWKTQRVNGKPTSRRVIKSLKPETLLALEQLKGPNNGAAQAATDGGEEEAGAGEPAVQRDPDAPQADDSAGHGDL